MQLEERLAGVPDGLSSREGTAGFPLLTVLALMAGIFAVGSEELVVSPLLVDMAGSFDMSVAVMALSVTVYGIGTAVGALLFAPLGDKVSRRLSLLVGMTVFVLGTVLCASAAWAGGVLHRTGLVRPGDGCVRADCLRVRR